MHALTLLIALPLALVDDPKGPSARYDVLHIQGDGLLQVLPEKGNQCTAHLSGVDLPEELARANKDKAVRAAQVALLKDLLTGRKIQIESDPRPASTQAKPASTQAKPASRQAEAAIKAAPKAALKAAPKAASKTVEAATKLASAARGDISGQVYRAEDRLWINRELILAGLASTGISTASSANLADLQQAEREARDAGRGIWSDKELDALVQEHEQKKAGISAANKDLAQKNREAAERRTKNAQGSLGGPVGVNGPSNDPTYRPGRQDDATWRALDRRERELEERERKAKQDPAYQAQLQTEREQLRRDQEAYERRIAEIASEDQRQQRANAGRPFGGGFPNGGDMGSRGNSQPSDPFRPGQGGRVEQGSTGPISPREPGRPPVGRTDPPSPLGGSRAEKTKDDKSKTPSKR